jgi:hypothetical protein
MSYIIVVANYVRNFIRSPLVWVELIHAAGAGVAVADV